MVNKNTDTKSSIQKSQLYPPVVAVLGHVDHGKTTLLDAIRKTNIVEAEFGGITQKIGAYTVNAVIEGKQKRITFIDTPGHEAFIKMRGRGAQAADIGLLVVSSTDGVMPQTKESISLLKTTQIPFICVLTKSDLPNKNPEKIKQQLLKEGVMLEKFGGDVPVIEVSAKANANIKELLELILLVSELRKEKMNFSQKDQNFKAIVIESKLDPKSGPKATIIIKNGSVSVTEEVVADGSIAKVRSLINDKNERLEKAMIGDAVEVLGFEKVPPIGSIVVSATRGPVNEKSKVKSQKSKLDQSASTSEASAFSSSSEKKPDLSIILCADTLGSLEAIRNSLPEEVDVVLQKTGEVTPADILFAKSAGAIVIGFNIKVRDENTRLAAIEKVLFKNYNIIYDLLNEINDVIKGKKIKVEEEVFGKAYVLASFPYEKTKVLGIKVLEGRVARGDKARLMRREKVIGESKVSSLRTGKEVVSKVEKGKEAGIILGPFLDFEIGDMLVFMP